MTFIDDFNFSYLNGNSIAMNLFDSVILLLLQKSSLQHACHGFGKGQRGGSPTVKEGLFVFDETLSPPSQSGYCTGNKRIL